MLHGQKVGLGPLEEEDLALLVEWFLDPGVQPLFHKRFVPSYGRRPWYRALSSDRTRTQFMIVDLESGDKIGTIGLNQINYRHQEAQVAPFVIKPPHGGAEIVIDAVTTLVLHAFRDHNLHRLYCEIPTSDLRIQNTIERIGFRSEGVLRKAAFLNGEFQDLQLMGLLREEWTIGHSDARTEG